MLLMWVLKVIDNVPKPPASQGPSSCLSISVPPAHSHSPICNTLTYILPHHLYLMLLNPAETHDLSGPHFTDSGILLTTGLQQVNPFCFLCRVDNRIRRLHRNPNVKLLQGHEQKLDFFSITIGKGLHVILVTQTAYLPFPSLQSYPGPASDWWP